MISEEQLQTFEGMAKELLHDGSLLKPVVYHLIAEVRGLQKTLHAVSDTSNNLLDDNNQLEKEADWLAEQLISKCCNNPDAFCGGDNFPSPKHCKKCWREAAQKAVQRDN